MRHSLFYLIAVLTMVFAMAGAGSAQVTSLITGGSDDSTEAPGSELTEAIKQAAESGMSLVIIDSEGRVVTASPEPAEDDAMGEGDDASMLMATQSEVKVFRETLRERLRALPNSINEVAYILRATSPDGEIWTYVEVFLWTVGLMLLSGFATIQLYGKRIASRFVIPRIVENPVGYRQKMPFLVFRFFVGMSATIIMIVLANLAGWVIFGSTDDLSIQFTVLAIYTAFFMSRTVADLWRMLLSPFLSQYRIPYFSDQDAKRLYQWMRILATLNIWVVMFTTWIGDFGLNYNVYAILYGALALITTLGNVLMVLFNRRAISLALRNGRAPSEVPWLSRVLSVAWAPLLIGYVIFGWFELSFDLVMERAESVPLVAGAYAVFLSIVVVYGVINYVIERYFDRSRLIAKYNEEADAAETGEAEEVGAGDEALPESPLRQHPLNTYEDLARRVAAIVAFVAGGYALLRVWDPEDVIMSTSIVDRLLDVIVILFIGYVVFHFFRIWIDGKIAEESVDESEVELGDEGGAGSASRLATLLPLFRGAILAVVVVAVIMIALMELGINVSPLFAGAGVVGLAVGFGAQTLVRDIFSGAFFLLDDAFRKGEYIDIGDVKGTVEKISIRSFQLRHHLGALNTIPFGEIRVLTNYSRDWVIMKLPLRVTYDTDVEKVRKLVKKLGIELLDDPVIGDNFIQPLKSQGVIEMQDSAMIIRVKFMTKPGDQWLVRKRVYEEIRQLFAREGIKFAHREVTVRLADEQVEGMSEEKKEAIAGAVQAAIDEDGFPDQDGGDDR